MFYLQMSSDMLVSGDRRDLKKRTKVQRETTGRSPIADQDVLRAGPEEPPVGR